MVLEARPIGVLLFIYSNPGTFLIIISLFQLESLLAPVDSISKWFATICVYGKRPQILICSKDLVEVGPRTSIELALEGLSFALEVFDGGFVVEEELEVELEEDSDEEGN